MNRWGFVKRFGKITCKDFKRFAQQFCETVDSCYESSSKIEVEFYKQIRRDTSSHISEKAFKCLNAENKNRRIIVVNSCEKITEELFDKAAYVRLMIKSIDNKKAPPHVFGVLECKGLLSRHLVYYIQPEEVGRTVKRLHLNEQRPSRLLFGITDGWENCGIVQESYIY